VLLSPYAPHISEELWTAIGNEPSVTTAKYPEFKEEYVKENTFEYPVSFNGKMRFKLEVAAGTAKEEVEKLALADERAQRWLEGKQVRKVIVVPNKIVNVVVG
jgi:leucyl-tRNA synthetase